MCLKQTCEVEGDRRRNQMRKTGFYFIGFLLVVALCAGLSACNNSSENGDIWKDAVYTEDTELGAGGKTVLVDVVAGDKTVTFTIHSDKENLGDVLTEQGLIEGENGAYGLYVKKVNGITADYDIDKSYWGFNKNGEGMMTGVDGAMIEDGDRFELVYTK